MEVITRYCCGLCHTPYKEKKDALACEKGHKEVVQIKDARYNPISVCKNGYPVTLDVLLTDGSVKKYHL